MSNFFRGEKKDPNALTEKDSPSSGGHGADVERRMSTTVQGKKWNRIAPPNLRKGDNQHLHDSDEDMADKLVEMEADNAIKYRTCHWWKTAALLFSEYICLAIMSFPYSYSVLGLVPGLILTVVQAAFVLYTSLTVWYVQPVYPKDRAQANVDQGVLPKTSRS